MTDLGTEKKPVKRFFANRSWDVTRSQKNYHFRSYIHSFLSTEVRVPTTQEVFLDRPKDSLGVREDDVHTVPEDRKDSSLYFRYHSTEPIDQEGVEVEAGYYVSSVVSLSGMR